MRYAPAVNQSCHDGFHTIPLCRVADTLNLCSDSGAVEKSSGEAVEVSFEKMSKSKLNGVDPQNFVSEWGITMTRLFVLYAAAPSEIIHWDTKSNLVFVIIS